MQSKKILFLRISNLTAILWSSCVIGVITILTFATKLATHDPDFSQGYPESIYLLPMLSMFFIGFFAFISMIVSSVISLFIKSVKVSYNPPLGISTKKTVLFVVVILFGVLSFLFGYRQANFRNYSNYTGQDVFNAINDYRKQKGLNQIILNPELCDNLIQRYLDITNPKNAFIGHAGFEQWVKTEGLEDYTLAELYIKDAPTVNDAMSFWLSSPGHKSSLDADYDRGCSYANENTSVVILGKKIR